MTVSISDRSQGHHLLNRARRLIRLLRADGKTEEVEAVRATMDQFTDITKLRVDEDPIQVAPEVLQLLDDLEASYPRGKAIAPAKLCAAGGCGHNH